MSETASPVFPGDPLLNRTFLTPEQKRDWDNGKEILRSFYTQQNASPTNLNFFRARQLKFMALQTWAKGSQNVQDQLDYMNISDANNAYLKIDTTPSRSGPQYVETLVESMAKTKMYPCVKAVDDGSLSDKEGRLWDALYRMLEVQTIANIQQASGVQVEPTNAFVPDDELSARIYFEFQDKAPKEVRFEKYLESIMEEIRFEAIMNRRTLRDIVIMNMSATKIDKVGPGKYIPRKCVTNNMIYNFFIGETGETEVNLIGEFTSVKVKDIRRLFGKSPTNPQGLTEEQIFNLAKQSNHQASGSPFNFQWSTTWADASIFNQNRPYDDSNIYILDAEVDMGEDLYYVERTDPYGKVAVELKKGIPYQTKDKSGNIVNQPKPDNVQIKKRPKQTWMRGVYAPYSEVMLYWGAPDLIISEYTNVFKGLSSFTIIIPQNDGDYVPSLFERGMDKLRDYQLVTLKRRQLIALVEPDGFTIDVENCRNLDLGSGNSVSWEQVLRIKNQTGAQLYSSLGTDPNQPLPPPITPGVPNSSINRIMELTNVLTGLANEIRQLLGIPMYRDGADVGDRTAAALAEGQNASSYNVTDYTLNANKELWSRTFYKLCLLKWNDIVKMEPETKDDILNTRFNVSVELKSTDYQKQQLDTFIQQYSQMPDAQGNPSISPKDAMMLRQIGEDNYKAANWYLANVFEYNRTRAIQESQMLQQQNQALQQQSAQQNAQQDLALQAQKQSAEKDMLEYKALQEMKVAIVTGSFAIAAKGEGAQMPQWLGPIVQQLVPNLEIPIQKENQQMGQQIAADAAEEQAESQQGQAPGQQQPGQPMSPGGPQQSPQMAMQ